MRASKSILAVFESRDALALLRCFPLEIFSSKYPRNFCPNSVLRNRERFRSITRSDPRNKCSRHNADPVRLDCFLSPESSLVFATPIAFKLAMQSPDEQTFRKFFDSTLIFEG